VRRIIINMKDYVFADAVAQSLQADRHSDFVVQRVTTPEEVLKYSAICDPYAVLMEVNGYPPYALEERLKIRDTVKKENPSCKVVLVVDENSEKKVAEEVRQAKKDGRIDQFIYGSISANYLVALMDTL
jgi:DNA-binding NarL/FixJ family response regulator